MNRGSSGDILGSRHSSQEGWWFVTRSERQATVLGEALSDPHGPKEAMGGLPWAGSMGIHGQRTGR